MRLKLQSALAVAALAVAVAGSATELSARKVEGSFERTLTVTGPVELKVTSVSGDITVRPGETGQVTVRAFIKANRDWFEENAEVEARIRQLEANPPIVQEGNTLRIGELDDRELNRYVSIDYELVVPPATALRAETSSGDLKVSGVRGPVKAASGSGDFTFRDIQAQVDISTGSGDIYSKSLQGAVRIATGSGDIELSDAAGAVKIATGSGDVMVDGSTGRLEISTGSGDIQTNGSLAEEWLLRTGSGDIDVRVPAGAAFDIIARSDSGSVYTKHSVTVEGSVKPGYLKGKVRGGGVLLDLHSGSGDIHID